MRSVHADLIREGEIKRPAADGRGFIAMWPPHHPRKGTIMVGDPGCGEEPEWSEQTAWEALTELVFWNFVEVSSDGEIVTPTRNLKTPGNVFRAAAEMIAAP
jgi:hypothetical protein